MRLSRFYSTYGMFAKACCDDYYAIIRKRTARESKTKINYNLQRLQYMQGYLCTYEVHHLQFPPEV